MELLTQLVMKMRQLSAKNVGRTVLLVREHGKTRKSLALFFSLLVNIKMIDRLSDPEIRMFNELVEQFGWNPEIMNSPITVNALYDLAVQYAFITKAKGWAIDSLRRCVESFVVNGRSRRTSPFDSLIYRQMIPLTFGELKWYDVFNTKAARYIKIGEHSALVIWSKVLEIGHIAEMSPDFEIVFIRSELSD